MEKNEILDYVTHTPENTNRAVLGDMLDNYSGGVLPAVTSDDNGDVLTVVEGAWGKAAPSGGGSGVLVVTATEDADTGVLTLDKTASEIYSAMKSGGVMVDAEDASYGIFPFVWSFYLSTGAYNFYAITISPVDGSVEGTFRFQALTGADYPSYTPSN